MRGIPLRLGAAVALALAVGGTALAEGSQAATGATEARTPATHTHTVAGWRAAPVSYGAGFSRRDGSPRVRVVQRRLRRLGFAPGPIDGLFGPRTLSAVRAFQQANGLADDGIVGAETSTALRITRSQGTAFPSTRKRGEQRISTAGAGATAKSSPRTLDPAHAATAAAKGEAAVTSTPHGRGAGAARAAAEVTAAATTGKRAAPRAQRGGEAERTGYIEPLAVALASALVAQLLLSGAFTLRRREFPPVEAAAVSRARGNLYLEATSRDPSMGTVRGFAVACARGRSGDGSERSFLVSDPSKPAPVWVSESEVRSAHGDWLDRDGLTTRELRELAPPLPRPSKTAAGQRTAA